ncbi:MAG: helix-turn-helix domain-containing protein [Parabacteroides sp.]
MDKSIKVIVGTLPGLVERSLRAYRYANELEIILLEGERLNQGELPDIGVPLWLDAFNVFITLAGEAWMEVDSVPYRLEADTIMNLIGCRMLRNVRFSDDYRGYHLLVSKHFYDEIFKEGKHLTPEVAMRKTHCPYDRLSPAEGRLLAACLEELIRTVCREEHVWYRRMVENESRKLLMEVGNLIMTKSALAEQHPLSERDKLFQRFMLLVRDYAQERKSVRFYADKLCLSPDYLTHAIKAYSARTVSYWINEALLQQAKSYLLDPRLSLWQIAEKLNFSDQSAFGRFFKKHTGQSPAAYRKGLG